MPDYLDDPLLFALISLVITFGSLFVVYMEMPPRIIKKTGKTRPIGERLSGLSKNGKVFLFVSAVSAVGSIAAVIDLLAA
ncbi:MULTISPECIES: hypothetical protein [Trueperella]|uniref:Uncharacterized protein n=1 Tax=Trueperella abortisuis TaxID=445930 RepID=A0ABT9PL22_9ACTO|nr:MULTISPECIES: hypothetical protein [Trueperella]MCI7305691.1 hypothetical protein [Trueperella sp.]MDP9833413.1 hypothetical protein [Trueperella abortisuis]